MTTPDARDDLEALLAGMRDEFLRTAAERVDAIRRDSEDLAIVADRAAALHRVVREAHTLKGGGATFGFPSLGEAGAAVEQQAKILLVVDERTSGKDVPAAEPLRSAVRRLVEVLAEESRRP